MTKPAAELEHELPVNQNKGYRLFSSPDPLGSLVSL